MIKGNKKSLYPSQYTIKKEFTYSEMAKLVKVAREALFNMNDKRFFDSIELNIMLEGSNVGIYDSTKTGISEPLYKGLLNQYIESCNNILITRKMFKNYIFDIDGNWKTGSIIIMEKK